MAVTAAGPDILFEPLARVRAMQDRLLAETVRLCYEGHPFYRRLMKAEGLDPGDLQSCADLRRLPVTTKQDYLADPEAFRLVHDGMPIEAQTLWNVIYTTGTTSGRPAPIYTTSHDYFAYMYAARRRMHFVGLRDTDVAVSLFPLTPFPLGAYSRAVDEAAACGASIVYAQTGRTTGPFHLQRSLDEAVALIVRQRGTVLWGISSFVRRVLIRAAELRADFSAVRMVMVTGEASSPAMVADMARRMAALGCAGTDVVNRYGSTEQGSSMVECQPGGGFHCLAPDQVFYEVIDADTGSRLPDGERGMLTFTHLIRRGTVFLRYAVGDVVSMQTGSCPNCGRTSPRIASDPVRSGDIVKVKGTLVNLYALKDALASIPEIDEYQIIVQHAESQAGDEMDELLIRLAARPGTEEDTGRTVIDHTIRTTYVRPRLEFASQNEIFDPGMSTKPRRIEDRRRTEPSTAGED